MLDYLTVYCYNKSYKSGKGVSVFAVSYGACGSGSGTTTRRLFRMKLIEQISLALITETGWLCCYVKNPGVWVV
jgi:hypothetical protein